MRSEKVDQRAYEEQEKASDSRVAAVKDLDVTAWLADVFPDVPDGQKTNTADPLCASRPPVPPHGA